MKTVQQIENSKWNTYLREKDCSTWANIPWEEVKHQAVLAHDVRIITSCGNVRKPNIQHKGWFADGHQDALHIGVVLRMGKIYLPGIRDTDDELVCFELKSATRPCPRITDPIECAEYADSLAEKSADEAREYRLKDDAEQRIEELKEHICGLRKKAADAIRKEIRDTIKAIRRIEQTPESIYN